MFKAFTLSIAIFGITAYTGYLILTNLNDLAPIVIISVAVHMSINIAITLYLTRKASQL